MTINLTNLEKAAIEATPGPWIERSDCAVYDSINEQVCFVAHNRQNTNFIDSFNPQTALALIAVCRAAKNSIYKSVELDEALKEIEG